LARDVNRFRLFFVIAEGNLLMLYSATLHPAQKALSFPILISFLVNFVNSLYSLWFFTTKIQRSHATNKIKPNSKSGFIFHFQLSIFNSFPGCTRFSRGQYGKETAILTHVRADMKKWIHFQFSTFNFQFFLIA
jgi:hypothetical protein